MLSVSKHLVKKDMSFFMKVKGVKKRNKRIRVTCCSVTSQNNAKNEQHKYRVKIYTVITLSLHFTPFFVL